MLAEWTPARAVVASVLDENLFPHRDLVLVVDAGKSHKCCSFSELLTGPAALPVACPERP